MNNTRGNSGSAWRCSWPVLRHPALVGGQIHRKAPPMPERVRATRGTVYKRADIEPAARSGSRSAACSSARSGATAAMSRRTGPPTGCTAKSSPGSTSGRARRCAAGLRRAGRGRAGGPRAGCRPDPREHVRSDDRHHHARRGPRGGHFERRRALRKPVRQRSGDARCAKPTR